MKHIRLFAIVATLVLAGTRVHSAPPAELPPGHPPVAEKQQLPEGHPSVDMNSQTLPPGTTTEAGNPKWDVPKGWQPGRASNMRRATFIVKGEGETGAEIAITVFPGDVGGAVANVNRWRGQLGLGSVDAKELAGITEKVDVNGIASTVVDFANKAIGKRMMVATIPQAGNSWFIKMTGDTPVVEAQKAAFLSFVKSVKF